MVNVKKISKPLQTRAVTPADYRELTPDEAQAMREHIAFFMTHGVVQGQVFAVDFGATNEKSVALIIENFHKSGARYRRHVFAFGWRLQFSADVSIFAEIADQIFHGRYAAHEAEELFGEIQTQITKADRLELAKKLNFEEIRQDLIVERLQKIIGNPTNWRNPPPASVIFVLGPLLVEEV